MIRCDLTHWPLALIIVGGPVTPAAQEAALAEWTAWLDRGERFAVLWVSREEEGLACAVALARGASDWMHANAARLQDRMLGIAGVVPPEHFEQAMRSDMVRLPGVPGQIVVHLPAALDFLEWFIAPSTAPGWDRAAVRTSVNASCAKMQG